MVEEAGETRGRKRGGHREPVFELAKHLIKLVSLMKNGVCLKVNINTLPNHAHISKEIENTLRSNRLGGRRLFETEVYGLKPSQRD